MIYVEAPETSGIDVAHLSSPIATLGCYDGHCSHKHAPDWTRIPIGVPFDIRQPCHSIANVFSEIAMWPENTAVLHVLICSQIITSHLAPTQPKLTPMMMEWAYAVSVSPFMQHRMTSVS